MNNRLVTIIVVLVGLSTATPTIASQPSGRARVRLKPAVTVHGQKVWLGQIAEISGPAVWCNRLSDFVIDDDFSPGQSHRIRMVDLVDALLDGGFNLLDIELTGAGWCQVSRPKAARPAPSKPKGQVTEQPRLDRPPAGHLQVNPKLEQGERARNLAHRIKQFIADKLHPLPKGGLVNVTFDRVANRLLALGQDEYQFQIQRAGKAGDDHSRSMWLGMVPLRVQVYKSGKLIEKAVLLVDVDVSVPALVARRTINSKQVIQADDVERVLRGHFRRLDKKPIADVRQLAGMRARRLIPAGSVITADMIEPAPLVKRGELVTVLYRSGGLSIRAVGRARETGMKGQLITVQNESTRQVFVAQVIGAGVVQLKGSGYQPASDHQAVLGVK